MNYYKLKGSEYHTGIRMDIISLLPQNTDQRVLEIGAGGGDTLHYIKENKLAREVVGLELFKLEGTKQGSALIDNFIIGNIEEPQKELQEKYFDIIILADVLEHLVDPWTVLEKVSSYLKEEGKILVSLPNIREINTMVKILCLGDFRYKEDGILDKTHLRFFCKKNMLEMLNSNSLETISVRPAFKIRKDRSNRRLLNLISFGLLEGFWTFQYLFVVGKRKVHAN